MTEERDRYLKNLYGSPEIVVGNEGEPYPIQPGMPVYLKVDFEETKEAEDWFGLEQDLGFVIRAATQAAERYASQKRGEALQKVLEKGKELTKDQIRGLPHLEVKPVQGYEAAKLPRPPRQ